jgi:hypothetical protein
LIEFNQQLNIQANIRDYLISFTTNLVILTSNSIILQASSLAQLTQATNQLTRTTAVGIFVSCFSQVFLSEFIKYRRLHQINVIN